MRGGGGGGGEGVGGGVGVCEEGHSAELVSNLADVLILNTHTLYNHYVHTTATDVLPHRCPCAVC